MEHPRHQYPEETAALQQIGRECGLAEKIKWGKPCLMLGDRNIALIQRFNHYVALLFFKGALLRDPDNLLHRIGENTQAARQLRFTALAEITSQSDTIRGFLQQTIELERAGAKVATSGASAVAVPAELQDRLDRDPALNRAFAALTPGRQKAYLYQITAAKQSATRRSRIEKFIPRILAGKGLND